MSPAASLTVIAIALAILALVVIGGVVVLALLIAHLLQLERALERQVAVVHADLQEVFGHVKSASRQVEAVAARSEGLMKAVGTVAALASAMLWRRPEKSWRTLLLSAAGRGLWQWVRGRRRRKKAPVTSSSTGTSAR